MRQFRTFAGLTLAFILLAATLHCRLETTGILPSHCEQVNGSSGCGTDGSCAGDGCKTVENGAYKVTNSTPKVPAPQYSVCAAILWVDVTVLALEDFVGVGFAIRSDFEQPLDWVPSWQFVRRAAPLSRAPSLMVA